MFSSTPASPWSKENPDVEDCDRAGEHLCSFLQSGQGFTDQLSLGSARRVNDHRKLLTVYQENLKDIVCFFSMEGLRVEEVEPDELLFSIPWQEGPKIRVTLISAVQHPSCRRTSPQGVHLVRVKRITLRESCHKLQHHGPLFPGYGGLLSPQLFLWNQSLASEFYK